MNSQENPLVIGLLVNPCAGLGGAVALKGSDGEQIMREALARGAVPQAGPRTQRALALLAEAGVPVLLRVWGGDMGADWAQAAGLPVEVIGQPGAGLTSAEDTRTAAAALVAAGIDVLLFAGGDGTARDVLDSVGAAVPALGIPAGCKMHSAVYAVNPEAAGRLLVALARGELVNVMEGEVRDIDEVAFRNGQVRARYYGSLSVPADARLLQQVKCGAPEQEDLQVGEACAWLAERMAPGVTYLMGSGSTVAALMEQLGLPNTLLGVDLVRDGALLAADVTADQILEFMGDAPARAVLTVIGGQGHLFGRGNQQLSPAVIRRLGRDGLHILATRIKLASLDGRPLLVDTGDAALDRDLCGLLPVIAGYEDEVLYRVATDASE
ncbi:ATP-NAD kinase family protein [Alcanivorax sp. JB21]|uniref:ATP-NAD kinase family protein n=1 Tax=Alcanivorax limicola TaxID=2874102 RepID=UPI001CBE9F7D|nr:ATP-NAD kinase family protein [Alcanivorax limicola]MBZ2187524.1 ATP-NAD kinase family protein [Alcanivorax limicola]